MLGALRAGLTVPQAGIYQPKQTLLSCSSLDQGSKPPWGDPCEPKTLGKGFVCPLLCVQGRLWTGLGCAHASFHNFMIKDKQKTRRGPCILLGSLFSLSPAIP